MANSALRIGVALTNFDEVKGMLVGLPPAVEQNVIGVALTKAGQPIVKIAKSLVRKDTGALQASLTTSLRKYPKKSVLLIGPDRDYYVAGKRLKKGQKAKGKVDRPSNYAHLVEFGFVTRSKKKGRKRMTKWTQRQIDEANAAGRSLPSAGRRIVDIVPPAPFLRPAASQGQAAAVKAFEDGAVTGLVRETKKLGTKLVKIRGKSES